MREAPLIFCHYGNSSYLRYTLECARLSNPEKTIVLLGDSSNRFLARAAGIHHRPFDDYMKGPEIALFEKVYRPVQGKEHRHRKGGRDWLKFVFQRWFLVHNFLQTEGVMRFWHFDSDNMIVDPLEPHEARFSGYDCTEQCQGMCMNGFVTDVTVVTEYLAAINALFQNDEYLETQQREFDEESPKFAFTEMRAYERFKRDASVRSVRLSRVFKGGSFDDCLCVPDGMTTETLHGKTVKKVSLIPGGGFFCRDMTSQKPVEMHSLNLSYLPTYVFALITAHVKKRDRSAASAVPDLDGVPSLGSLPVPLRFRSRLKRANRVLEAVTSRLGSLGLSLDV